LTEVKEPIDRTQAISVMSECTRS